MARRRVMPRQDSAVVDRSGRVVEPWRTYIDALPSEMPKMNDLPATPTAAETAIAFNSLLAKLRAAGLMEKT